MCSCRTTFFMPQLNDVKRQERDCSLGHFRSSLVFYMMRVFFLVSKGRVITFGILKQFFFSKMWILLSYICQRSRQCLWSKVDADKCDSV